MATHFICQSTEPLPHTYPTAAASKSHGAVSQYELYNSSNKPHTRFPPPGWDFSQTSEEDSLPLINPVPQPASKNTAFHFDPDLCVTPQKSKAQIHGCSEYPSKPEFQPDPDLTLTPQKTNGLLEENANDNARDGKKYHVRFDLDDTYMSESDTNLSKNIPSKSIQNKPYQPELYGGADDNEIEESENDNTDRSRTIKYTVKKESESKFAVVDPLFKAGHDDGRQKHQSKKQQDAQNPASDVLKCKKSVSKSVKIVRETQHSKSQPSIKSATTSAKQTTDSENADHIAACKMPESHGAKRKAKVLRENQYTPKETEFEFPFDQNDLDYAGGDEHMFARPEYNSTLRMKLEAEKLKESEVDIQTALQRKLRISESVKTDINEKAAAHVNSESPAFSGLVSLNVPVEEMCKQAVELKTARAKHVKMPKSKLKGCKEPDVLEFFSKDRQKESVSFTLPGVPSPSAQLSTASNLRAFDLYKHNRVWNSAASRR